jgi:O-antigen ligase/Tfp pilus assembly protein PilF
MALRRALLLLAAIHLGVLLPLAWESAHPGLRLFGLGVILSLGVIWVIRRVAASQPFGLPLFSLPLFAFFAYQLLSMIWAPLPYYGLQWVLLELVVLVVFLFVLDTSRSASQAIFWEDVLIGTALLHAILGILYFANWYTDWHLISGSWFSLPPYLPRVPGVLLGHPNVFAGFLNLAIPLVLARILKPRMAKMRWVWGPVFLLLVFALFLSNSRGGFLAFAGAMVVTVGLYYLPSLRGLRAKPSVGSAGRPVSLRSLMVAGGVLVAVVLLIAGVVSSTRVAAHGTASGRMDIYLYSLKQALAHPLEGNGIGATPFLLAGRSNAYGGDEAYHAHNLWLQVGVESGIIGLALVLVAIFFILRAGRSAWKAHAAQPLERACLAAYAGAGASVLVNSLFDLHFRRIAVVLGVFIILALLYRLATDREVLRIPKMVSLITGIITLGAIVAVPMLFYRGQQDYWAGIQSANQDDWEVARLRLCLAAQANPANTFYAFQCSLAQARAAVLGGDLTALEAAAAYQAKALEIDPYWYVHWANLASYEWQLGQREAAVEQMQQAAEMAPTRPFIQLNLAWMQEQLGDLEQSKANYRAAICRQPSLREFVALAESQTFQDALQMDCPQPDPQPVEFEQRMSEAILALDNADYAAAEIALRQAISLQPASATPYAYLALAHSHAGQPASADQDLLMARFINSGDPAIQTVEAQLARRSNDPERESQHLMNIYRGIADACLSDKYYGFTYLLPYSPVDLSPYLLRGDLTTDLQVVFTRLVNLLTEQGETAQAEAVRGYLDRQSNP